MNYRIDDQGGVRIDSLSADRIDAPYAAAPYVGGLAGGSRYTVASSGFRLGEQFK